MAKLTSLEICAGAGGQALGLEQAGFDHEGLVEFDKHACATLRMNRPMWNVIEGDLRKFSGEPFKGIDLLAGGVPCPPFTVAGKQLGADDERDLFPEALRLITEIQPKAVMLENVSGFTKAKFDGYRNKIIKRLERDGYYVEWRVLNASDFGVPQLRPRFILVGLKARYANYFSWPVPQAKQVTVGETLFDLMASNGWLGAENWKKGAMKIAPTLVGGSKKHGGPDLGPTRAKRQWAEMRVYGNRIANEVPDTNCPLDFMPSLTLRMAARIQGFPDDWNFYGGKTAAYRQIGNAFPPPVACAVGKQIYDALKRKGESTKQVGSQLVIFSPKHFTTTGRKKKSRQLQPVS